MEGEKLIFFNCEFLYSIKGIKHLVRRIHKKIRQNNSQCREQEGHSLQCFPNFHYFFGPQFIAISTVSIKTNAQCFINSWIPVVSEQHCSC